MKTVSKDKIKEFQKTIWDYYKKEGRKMPWRGEKDPYKIVVSEIMLQQTQVSRVTLKYKEFLEEFPSLKRLGNASLADVLKVWRGLGYNRRAKFLHSFAKEVALKYKDKIPNDVAGLELLPGIGKATAGSISAFAFNKPVVFIETNIRRVYIHFFFPKSKSVSDKNILELVEKSLDRARPREWYYALMDYGAYLKTQVENPNRKSRYYTKQSKFVGSNREVRGAILKQLTVHKKQLTKKMEKDLGFEKKRFDTALAGLVKEGFVQKKGNRISIHHGI